MPEKKPRDDGPTGLEAIRDIIKRRWNPPIAKLIGFRLTAVGEGTARVELDAGHRHSNPMGTLHGGIICDIADAAMGIAYVSTLGPGESFTTVELKMNYLRPVWEGHLVAEASVLKKGRTTGFMTCSVLEGEGRLVAFATSTCMTIISEPGSGLTRERRREAGKKGR